MEQLRFKLFLEGTRGWAKFVSQRGFPLTYP